MKKLSLAVLATAALATVAIASDVGQQREDTMKGVGGSFKALAAIVKGAPFDAALVKEKGENIAANLDHFGTLFEPGTENASKEASPLIWPERETFDKIRTDGIAAAKALAGADEAGFKAAFANLGGACKSCHEKYRQD